MNTERHTLGIGQCFTELSASFRKVLQEVMTVQVAPEKVDFRASDLDFFWSEARLVCATRIVRHRIGLAWRGFG
jgi:hypothetical protein